MYCSKHERNHGSSRRIASTYRRGFVLDGQPLHHPPPTADCRMTGWERARFSTVARGSNLVAASWRTEKSSVPTSSLSHAAKNDSSPKRLSEIRERSLWTWGTALATQNGPRSPGTRARTQAGQGIVSEGNRSGQQADPLAHKVLMDPSLHIVLPLIQWSTGQRPPPRPEVPAQPASQPPSTLPVSPSRPFPSLPRATSHTAASPTDVLQQTQGVPPPTQSATLFRLPSFHSLSPFRLFTTRFRLHHNLRHSFRIHLIALATPPAKPFHDPSHSPSHQTTSRY